MTPPGTEPAEGEVLLGQYRLDRLIGKGGMGKVFRAENLQNGGTVAVKILSASSHDDESRRRFAREATIMGRLDHPNLIQLFGHGEERGYPFLVMKFLEGKNLLETLETTTGRLSVAEALDVIGQLAAALDHLHGQGIVHRDLKLSNIFQGPDGKVTLLDMGLARAIPSTTQLTRVGVIWGTPEFMAPEQILGEAKLDGRADVYALAGIFFRILTGRLAFNPGDEQKLLESHVRAPRPELKAVLPTVPQAVSDVVKIAMSVRREERYLTAGAFHEALKAAFAGLPQPQPGDLTVVGRPSSRDMVGAKVVKLDGAVAADFDEPMTLPAIAVAFGAKASEGGTGLSPPRPERADRTVVTDISGNPRGFDENTALTEFSGAHARPTRLAVEGPPSTDPRDTGATVAAAAVGTDPSGRTAIGSDPDFTHTPQPVTAPGRPRNKDKDKDRDRDRDKNAQRAESFEKSRRTVLDEPSPFGSELPPWVTPWVMAAVGAGLVLVGFLLGLALR